MRQQSNWNTLCRGHIVPKEIQDKETAVKFIEAVEQFGTGAAAETRSYDPLLQRVEPGSCWQFRLTANPTKSLSLIHI